jgi:diguanylate cyclase (GGDEF)-like protein
LARVAPFAVLALAGEASLALPPGPVSNVDTVASVALLALTALLLEISRRTRSLTTALLIPLSYVASALMLILAAGGSTEGIGLIVILPILWASLNLEIFESLIVVLAVAAIELVTSFTPVDVTNTVRFRREFSFIFIGCLIVFSIRELRRRIHRSSELRDLLHAQMSETIGELHEQTRINAVLKNLVDMLNFCDVVEEAYEVFEYAVRQIFRLGGSINIVNPSTGQMERKCWWPGARSGSAPFDPECCFAVQSGQPYVSGAHSPLCGHFASDVAPPTQCHPLYINREVVGLLSVMMDGDVNGAANESNDQYGSNARLVGDQISVWLANFRLRESLKNLAVRDPLTNLFNRRFMMETLQREMAITARSHDATSVMQIDIDHFKEFNDSFGHDVGDAVLLSLADVMIGLFRDSDVPCRSGGEEFTLILPRCTWETAHVRALELQARVSTMVVVVPDGRVQPEPPTLSIGIATSPEHGQTSDQLLRAADAAMYRAKSMGRNRIVRAVAPLHA